MNYNGRRRNCKGRIKLMHPHPLINFEIYFKNERQGVYCKLDKYLKTGTHWIALCKRKKKVSYFDSLGVEYALKN